MDAELDAPLAHLPRQARDSRYVKAAILRVMHVPWKDVATAIGLSAGRCQNLTQEPWWPELMKWAGKQTWGGTVLAAAVSRVLRCLNHLPLDSPEGLAYTYMALQSNGMLEPDATERGNTVNVAVGVREVVERLETRDLERLLRHLEQQGTPDG